MQEGHEEDIALRSNCEKSAWLLGERYQNGKFPVRCCPLCPGEVLPLTYGLKDACDSVNYELDGKLRFILAGCNVREAEWKCRSCGREFVSSNGGLSVLKEK